MTASRKTILIAEDNPSNMKLMKDVLLFHGYEIIEAEDGKATLDRARANKNIINLILMDIQLPYIDGLELIRLIKADNSMKNIPIFVVSAHAMEDDIKNAMDAGCEEYITKPVNLPEFIKKVNTLLN